MKCKNFNTQECCYNMTSLNSTRKTLITLADLKAKRYKESNLAEHNSLVTALAGCYSKSNFVRMGADADTRQSEEFQGQQVNLT